MPTESARDWMSFANFRRMLLLLSGVISLLLLAEAVRFIPVHDENVHTESAYIVSAYRWAHGLPLYSDIRKPPYLITPFPPFWYAVLRLAAKVGFDSLDSLTLFARLFSFFSLLGVAALSYFWNRRRSLDRQSSLLTPLFYLSLPLLVPMAVIARQDLPALLLSLAAIVIAGLRPRMSTIVSGAAVAALAFLSKHSSVAAPTTIVLWLVSLRRWKLAAWFCAVWGIVVLPVLIYFQFASSGTMMMNLSGAKFGPVGVKNLHDILVHLLFVPGAQMTLALFGFAIFGLLHKPDSPDDRERLLKIYFLVSLPLALFACSFANATANHFLEPMLAWALLVPDGVNALAPAWERARPQAILLFALTLVLAVPTLDVQFWSTRNERPDDIRSLGALVSGKRVLTDVSYLGARSAFPEFLDPISLTFSERAGVWSSQPLIQQLNARSFELVVLHWAVDDPRWNTVRYPRLPASMRKAISENYRLCFEADSNFFYAPRDSAYGSPSSVCPAQPGDLK